MPAVIIAERPDTPDATLLLSELQTHLESFYPPESRHGFSVERLIKLHHGDSSELVRLLGWLIDQKDWPEEVAFFVLRADGAAAGCGGVKLAGTGYGELKRMYVRPQFRGSGLGEMLLDRLAAHARNHGVTLLRLETGIHQQAAIRLYETYGFRRIAPFGPYTDDPLSRCYEKQLAVR